MLDEMKETGRSNLPGNKKSSSGCLIIKKKFTDSVRGASDSSSRNLFKSSKKKKRRRVADSDSESIDNQPQTIAQKVDNFQNGSVVYSEDGDFGTENRVSNGLDVFEFDEYDGFDEGMIRKDANDGSYRWKLYGPSLDQTEAGNALAYGAQSRPEMEDDDESDLPLSVLSKKYRSSSNKPIRLQGKNGVLKVMVNNNKQMGVSCRTSDRSEAEYQKEPTPKVVQKKKLSAVKRSDHSDAEDGQSSMSKRKEKGGLKYPKSKLANSSKEINETDTLMRLKSCGSGKVVKNEVISPPTQNATRVKGKESKVKCGSGTEKQLLREKIKKMLFAAGWTIDYRPRRNRDYMDAVYTSPAGTSYWSIIKAYDALQKEEEENSKAGGNFTPLADEILGKLTRQTQKRIEREMEKKRNSEGSSRNAKRAKGNEEAGYTDSESEEEKLNSYVKHSRKSKKSRLEEASQTSDDDSSENSYNEIPKNDRAAKTVHGRKSRKIGRCTLLVRSSDKGPYSGNDGLVAYSGKRTLLSWLIDSEVVQMSEHVQYMNSRKTRIMQKGWITKDGFHCVCCSKIVPVLKFELHAGSKLRQPFPNIYLQSGKSLIQCQIDAWNKQGEMERKGFYTVDVESDDPNDDTCGLCGDGGDLICCDGCPSTFHQSCLDIQTLPQGDWHCPNCSCKYCEIDGGNCTAICDKNEASLSVCCFCQKKYHESCRPEKDLKPIESNHLNLLFCEQKCQELHSHLQKLFGVKHELDSGFSWSLIHRYDLSADASSVELPHRVECNSMLAVAMSVMDECFLPIVERRSGINLIRNVLFNCGSNLERLNYSGFFTAILERGDEVVSAASIRIHGTQLAEMPFIGTRHIYRRQGMCRRLLSAIELALSSLEVEKLIIPAIAEHMHTWTDVFGFQPLEESHKQEFRSLNMLVFPGTDMLQKPLVKRIPQGNETAATNSCSQESCVPLEDDRSINKSELVSSSSCDPTLPAQVPDVASHATTVSCDIPCEPKPQHSTSVDPHFDSNVKESTVHEITPVADLVPSVVPCEPNVEEIAVQNDNGTDLLLSKVHEPSDDKIPTDNPFRSDFQVQVGLEKEPFSSVEEICVQNGCETTNDTTETEVVSLEDQALNAPSNDTVSPSNGTVSGKVHESSDDKIPTDNPFRSDFQVQVGLEKEPFSSVEEICMQNGCETTNDTTETEVVSLEDQALNAPSNDTVSPSNGTVSGKVHESSDDKIPTDNPFRSDFQVQVGLEKEPFSSVEEICVQNGCETTNDTTETEVVSLEDQALNAPSNDTVSPSNGTVSGKVHESSDDKIPTDNPFRSDFQVQVGLEKEPFSSVEEICMQNGCETTNDTTETEVVSLEDQALNAPSNDTVSPSNGTVSGKVHESSDDKIPTDNPFRSDFQVQVGLEKEPFSSVEEICVQNGCETTNDTTETEVVSLEDQALNAPSNDTVSPSNGTVSGLESEKVP